jgi:sugar phosphate isomerase/epimerase
MDLNVGLSSKVVTDRALDDVLEVAARCGYTGLELFGVPNHLPPDLPAPRVREVRRRCDDLGLSVVTLCTYVGGFAEASDAEAAAELETYRRYVEIANLLGCDLIRLWPDHLGRNLSTPREDHWLRAAHYLREAADVGLRAGTRVLIENHRTMTVNVDASLRLIRLIDRPNVVFNFDPGNMYLAGEEYGRAVVHCFHGRIGNVQVKEASRGAATAGSADATLASGGSYDLLLGEGNIDHQSYLGALAEIGYDGYYMAECHKTPTAEWPSDRIAEHECRALRQLLEQTAAAQRRPSFV